MTVLKPPRLRRGNASSRIERAGRHGCDCGVCEPECPAEAILPDTEAGLEQWLEVNTTFSAQWPNITQKRDVPGDADEFKGVQGKFEKFFSAGPGKA